MISWTMSTTSGEYDFGGYKLGTIKESTKMHEII
jgi:hypothetical protein